MVADWSPLWLSLRAAALSTAMGLALGPWLAFLLLRSPAAARLARLPLSIATPCLAGYALLASPFEWPLAAMVALVFSLPNVLTASASAFARINPDYCNAARGLGAGEWRVFWEIAAPLARGPILCATAFTFAVVAADYAAFLVLVRALKTQSVVSGAPLFGALAIGVAVHYLGSRLEARRTAV
jgi:molybdate transport system permease protein